ncbi:MAG: hypothetical protein NVS4B3_23310 [Gemmatimonadaceae bacterium]
MQMEAYRDQYAKLFRNGKDVAVIAISTNADTALASWARDGSFPLLFASDTTGAVGRSYGAFNAQYKLDDRSLFVIGPDGRVVYKTQPFREMVADAYADLGSAVERASAGGS